MGEQEFVKPRRLDHVLLREWNDTEVANARYRHPEEAVADHVRDRPDAVAVASGHETVTFAHLWSRSGRLAARLRALGAAPEGVVGVLLDRSPELVCAELAVARTGAAFLPMDPDIPVERCRAALLNADAAALITTVDRAETLSPSPIPIVATDSRAQTPSADGPDPDRPVVPPEALGYLIYTSGSTGKPKGVAISRDSLVHLIDWHRTRYAVTPGTRTAVVASPGFDASIWEIWPHLASGAPLLVPDDARRTDPAALIRWFTAERVEVCFLPTPMAEAVMAAAPSPRWSVRTILTGGDRLHRPPPPGWTTTLLVNHYGPTEVTVLATCEPVAADPECGPPSIGRPIASTRVHVLGPDLRLVRAGEPGQLWVSGRGVARGYHRSPRATADRFVPDPYGPVPGARMYGTGDLGRHLSDGRIVFLGRLDRQVKILGRRIEPAEIEAALISLPGIREAAVVAHRDGSASQLLVAFISLGGATRLDPEEIDRALRKILPGPMVPRRIVQLPGDLPRTAHGKIDHRRLVELAATETLATPYRPPASATERALAALFAEELSVDRIGADDDLLDLGATSLLLGKALARAAAELGSRIPLRRALEHSTIAGLADLFTRGTGSDPDHPPIPRIAGSDKAPLSFQQEQVWYLQRLHPDSRAYNFQSRLRLRGPLDTPALARSLDEIVRRHEIYRTSFCAREGRPHQVVHPPEPVPLPVIDLTLLTGRRLAAEVEKIERCALRARFRVDVLPLARWHLIRHAPRDHSLLHVEHHLVHDGWSFNLLVDELVRLYRHRGDPCAAALPDPAVRFVDFCAWQRRWIEGPAADRQLEFWKERLAGAPALLPLPTDRPRPAVATFRGDVVRFELSDDLTRELSTACRRARTTPFVLLFAAFCLLLHRWTGQHDLVVGSAVANRRRPELERVLGMFVNTLALRVRWSDPDPRFCDYLARIHEEVLESFDRQDLPVERLVEALRPARTASHSPLYQVAFSFHDSPLPRLEVPGLDALLVEGLSNGSAKFDLNVAVLPLQPGRPRTEVIWEYASDLFDRSTVLRMIGHLRSLLSGVLRSPDCLLSRLPMLSPGERWQLLGENNDTASSAPSAGPVHRRVQARARKAPDAVALVDDSCQLSYGEMDRRAAAWARMLLAGGLAPEERVVVCAPRTWAWAVGVLAIVRAGGSYVCLDPQQPLPRLRHMIEDSRCRWLLTDRATVGHLADLHDRIVVLDAPPPAGDASTPDDAPAGGVQQIYTVYTSGSTGVPKAVAVSHEALEALVDWHRLAYPARPDDRDSQVAGPAFDASVWELWPALTAGTAAVFPPAEARATPDALAGWLLRERISTAFIPTPLAVLLIRLEAARRLPTRTLLTGGDRLPGGPPEGLPSRLVNHYGPSENTVVATAHPVTAGGLAPPPIGRPITGVRAFVTDRHLQPVPVGVVGEICLAGDGLARGYPGAAALTAERFVPLPWADRPGCRIYKTGDLVRRHADGSLSFQGRVDRQIKVRGVRIELGDVEAAMRRHPGVATAVVDLRDGPRGEPTLAAWWVPSGVGGEVSERGLREHLRAELPEAMVPTRLAKLSAIPTTPNGKVDRTALHLSELPRPRGTVALRGHEAALAEIWAEILGVDGFGPEENFFDLGGHSLRLAELQARLAERFGLSIPLVELLEQPTLRELAARIAEPRDTVPDGPESVTARGPGADEGSRDRMRSRLAALRGRRTATVDEAGG